ncbi:hypothetical protein C8J43_11131 [Sphingomonas sp. PP-CE-1G-424]|nr:hypothetical protein C8J43_11131 [Sphingomonas sp. PP-CE-1G-424]
MAATSRHCWSRTASPAGGQATPPSPIGAVTRPTGRRARTGAARAARTGDDDAVRARRGAGQAAHAASRMRCLCRRSARPGVGRPRQSRDPPPRGFARFRTAAISALSAMANDWSSGCARSTDDARAIEPGPSGSGLDRAGDFSPRNDRARDRDIGSGEMRQDRRVAAEPACSHAADHGRFVVIRSERPGFARAGEDQDLGSEPDRTAAPPS